MGIAHIAGYAQSLCGAQTEATGNGLEASANKLTNRWEIGTKTTGASLPQFTVGDGCQVLTPQRNAWNTCTSRVPAAYIVPGTVHN